MKLIKIPLNAGALAKKKGIEKAPNIIVSKIENFFLKENGVLPFINIQELKINNENIQESNDLISLAIKKQDSPAIIVGGDHSLTYSAFKEFAKKHQNPGLIVFDAHLDCENNFSPPTHEDFLRVLIEEKHLKKENVVHIGLRNFHNNEIDFAKKNKLKIFDMREIIRDGLQEVADAFTMVARRFDAVYVSIDIDVLDPSFAPGTGYIEPGGLSTRELIYFIQRLKNLKNIEMWDLVEVNPDKDINELTSITAAKLLVEMA